VRLPRRPIPPWAGASRGFLGAPRLQLLLPGRDINSAHVGIQSPDPVVPDKALEFLDAILAPHLRKLLVPLIDGKVEEEDRATIATRLCASG